MAERLAILDTNVLGVTTDLATPLWMSVFRLCDEAGITPCLPEIVLHESANLVRESYVSASIAYLKSFKQISRYFDAPPIYVPDVTEILNVWDSDLQSYFRILPTAPEDAAEAIRREAIRQAPARAGRGARDTLIWMTVLRHAKEDVTVMLISRNTADFADQSNAALHPTLAAEAATVAGTVEYFNGVDSFVERIASKAAPPVTTPSLYQEVIGFELRDAVLDMLAGAEETEAASSAVVEVDEVRPLRAYEIESRGLALVEGILRIVGLGEGEPSALPVMRFLAWVDFGLSTGEPLSGEVQRVTPVRE